MVTIQIIKKGSGKVLSSGGNNALAERTSITVPQGYQVYFDAVPDTGKTFLNWESADGLVATADPITLTADVDGSITAYFSDWQTQGGGINSTMLLIGGAALGLALLFRKK